METRIKLITKDFNDQNLKDEGKISDVYVIALNSTYSLMENLSNKVVLNMQRQEASIGKSRFVNSNEFVFTKRH